MSTWKPNFDPSHLYFVSITAVNHLHLFEREVSKRLLLDTFDSFRLRKLMQLYCFVIMPNHAHFIAQFRAEYPLSSAVRDFKKHTSDRIIRQLKAEGRKELLMILADKVTRPEKQVYKVWDDDYNAKDVFSAEFFEQKMSYIHNNPCQEHWKLSQTPEEYLWSSARFYLTEEPCIIPIDDARKLLSV